MQKPQESQLLPLAAASANTPSHCWLGLEAIPGESYVHPHLGGCFRALPNKKPNPPLLKCPEKLGALCLDGVLCPTRGGGLHLPYEGHSMKVNSCMSYV